MAVHSALPPLLEAAEAAAGDDAGLALIGPFMSPAVAEAVEATAPRRESHFTSASSAPS